MTGTPNIDDYLSRLLTMRNLLSDPDHWHRGELHNPDKTAFCIAGAARYTDRGRNVDGKMTLEGARFYEWLQYLVPMGVTHSSGNFGEFNDYSASHSVIMEWLDLCIAHRLWEIDYCVEIEHDDITGQIVFPWMRDPSSMPDLTEASLEELLIQYKGFQVAA